jgi:plasmid segregation protein ParM
MSGEPIVRAADVGYGNTKYVQSIKADGTPQCALFPSIAVTPAGNMGEGMMIRKRDTMIVEVDGREYEVGPGAALAQGSRGHERVLNEDYVQSAQYMALMRGAMKSMNVPHIDHLIVGLPVKFLEGKTEVIKERLTGVHPLGGGQSVEVRSVGVVAQPVGGFIDFVKRERMYAHASDGTNLLIDPGFFTLDWVVAKGLDVMNKLSDSKEYGVSEILKSIARQLEREEQCSFDDLNWIDEGLRKGEVRIEGKTRAMDRYIKKAMEAVKPGIAALKNSIGHAKTIDRIYLVGGGARYFSGAIREEFPNHPIFTVQEAVFANVRGFQIAGEQMADRAQRSQKVAQA